MPISNFDRLAPVLAAVFFVLLMLQWRYPLRRRRLVLWRRFADNLLFALPAFIMLRLALLPIPLMAAAWAEPGHIGILRCLPLPAWAGVLWGVVLMDYAYYWWHVATHRIDVLWRFHNVHHTDLDMDVSTATRFHFGELLLSVAFRVAAVLLLGTGPTAQIVFELVFETAGQFHHSNWRLPLRLERLLSRLIITPRLHGIHHSIVREETDSNWGTILSLWDTLHRTARRDVAQDTIDIGVPGYRDLQELTVGRLWQMPFCRQRDWRLPDGSIPARLNTDAPENIA